MVENQVWGLAADCFRLEVQPCIRSYVCCTTTEILKWCTSTRLFHRLIKLASAPTPSSSGNRRNVRNRATKSSKENLGQRWIWRWENLDLTRFSSNSKTSYRPNSTWLVTSRHDTFEVLSPCILPVSSLSNSMAQHERNRRESQLSLLCNSYKVMICKLFTNLLEYTFI